MEQGNREIGQENTKGALAVERPAIQAGIKVLSLVGIVPWEDLNAWDLNRRRTRNPFQLQWRLTWIVGFDIFSYQVGQS